MADSGPDEAADPSASAAAARPAGLGGWLLEASFLTGSVALLAGMASDFIGVISRHLHLPFIGAIEIIQACVLTAVAASMIAATLTRSHAAVHLLTERLSALWRGRFARVSDLLGFLIFAAFAAGSAWIVGDTWDWRERTDLLGVPILPLRLLWTASLLVVCVLFLLRALRPAAPAPAGDEEAL